VLTDVVPAPGVDRDELVLLAAAVEADSEHPLARAVVSAAEATAGSPRVAAGFEALPGRGVRATVDGRSIAVGGPRLVEERRVTVPGSLSTSLADLSGQGPDRPGRRGSARLLGLLALEDGIARNSAARSSELHTSACGSR